MDQFRISKMLKMNNLQDILSSGKVNSDEGEQIYRFLLINDYYISSEYEVVNTLFKVMVLNDLWDAQIALRYFEYLNYEGWEYECLIVRGILLENNLRLAGEFCLETQLVQNGLSYFRDNAIWRGKDYDNEDIPVSLAEWAIGYDYEKKTFYEIK
uniref:hypothetical protein n=1 Tax=uncultured Veillonella sp. TaxID=159268 RepID=UPI0025E7E0FB|nr:hypothetical protein [uncultured Veillonella sp.]